jgi:PIN domain nuclease of toxin-antitoxin system
VRDDRAGEARRHEAELLQELAGAQLLNEQLRRGVYAESSNRQHLIEQMPIAGVATDEGSVIQNANQPAAELFAAQARHEELDVISSDRVFGKYGVKRVW